MCHFLFKIVMVTFTPGKEFNYEDEKYLWRKNCHIYSICQVVYARELIKGGTFINLPLVSYVSTTIVFELYL